MALIDNKILEADLLNKGVIGLPDTPNLSTSEMQEKFDEIAIDVITPKHNQLIDDILLENDTKMDKANPSGTGSLSLNRKADTTVGTNSVALGNGGEASATGSVAIGYQTKASGQYSHAEGYSTKASSANQFVEGKYNVEDSSTVYAHIVGGGTADDARANIATLDWSGNLVVAGDITDGSSNVLSGKQDTLVSGTNIKTVGGTTILGSGDIDLVTEWDDLSNKPFDTIGDNLDVDSDGVLSAVDTTYDVVDGSSDGLCPQLPDSSATTKFLRGDGTWDVPAKGSTVSWNQITDSGTKIATITIDSTPTDIYAPTGGGSATTFAGLDDVTVTAATLANGQVPTYNSTSQKWENANLPATSWSDVSSKPFSSIGTNLSVDGSGVLSATDTTYESKTAAQGGTAVSLCTTGEKYTWNNKADASAVGVWATPVSASVGATSVTFSNASIATTSILDLYSENTSGTPIQYSSATVTTGSVTFTIPALTEATTFKLWIRNI